ncbi:MAG TPA: DNA polymerase III subunit beta [Tissierellia bacterium]|nr:DNA polymerase III subunit beta [Tissierellia bacterium]
MKIQVSQKTLSNHIGIVQKGIPSRTTLQILDGILMEAYGDKLKLISTDMEIGIETYLDCHVIEEGSTVINARIFGDIVRKLPDSTIHIELSDNNINIKCEDSEFNIMGYNPNEYPELPYISNEISFSIPKNLFRSAIRQTVFATAQDETRPIYTGVLLEIMDGMASFVALDGYRLSFRSIPVSSSENIKIVIPGRVLNELNKILGDEEEDMTIYIAPKNVMFNLGDTVVSSRLIEGQFLNYREMIRQEHKTSVKVDRKSFQDSLERASLLAKDEKANLVRLNIVDNQVFIKSNNEIGNVNERISSNKSGDDINIAFNSKYLLDGIKVIDSEMIELLFMGSLNPCIIRPIDDIDYTYLVLPVRSAQEDF